jgi:hypothetical protein
MKISEALETLNKYMNDNGDQEIVIDWVSKDDIIESSFDSGSKDNISSNDALDLAWNATVNQTESSSDDTLLIDSNRVLNILKDTLGYINPQTDIDKINYVVERDGYFEHGTGYDSDGNEIRKEDGEAIFIDQVVYDDLVESESVSNFKVHLAMGSGHTDTDGAWGPSEEEWTPVASLEDASNIVSEYIEYHELAASTFLGGTIMNNDKEVARVSYNGRVWDLDDNEITLLKNSPAPKVNP